ncbi:protein kinase domain-containing protein [Paenibacillus agilis]|uniref:Protein kinase n=1 Tax=Paenibacillus agilis TaxID=3020863 RepID=A0A559J074_9BACL|nr:protein kinase [Paenibacillus agilis]TVX93278.1 protein kinase [Paenibacillus agilis]
MINWTKSGTYSNVTPIQYNGIYCVKKELKEEQFSEKNLARFQREYEILKSIKHPNIIRVFEIEGASYIMEKADCDLEAYVLKNELSDEEVDRIIDGITSGLACLHEHEDRIIHRDLKPANVLMVNGVPKISDLGVCKPLENNFINTSAYSQELMGSIRYMSDSHKEGSGDPTFHYDIFALGRVIYFLEKKIHPPVGVITNYEGMRYHALVLLTEQQSPVAIPNTETFNRKRLSMISSKLSIEDSITKYNDGQIGMTELVASFSQRKSPRVFEVLHRGAKSVIDTIPHQDDQSLGLFFDIYMDLFESFRQQPYWDFKKSTAVTERLIELFDKATGIDLRRKLFLAAYAWSYDSDQFGAIKAIDGYMQRMQRKDDYLALYMELVSYLEISDMQGVDNFIARHG